MGRRTNPRVPFDDSFYTTEFVFEHASHGASQWETLLSHIQHTVIPGKIELLNLRNGHRVVEPLDPGAICAR